MSTLRKKYLGDRGFYRYVLGIVVPIMIQNGITNFVSLLDNIMIGRLGTLQMSSVSIANQFVFIFNLCVFGAVAGAAGSRIASYLLKILSNSCLMMAFTCRAFL